MAILTAKKILKYINGEILFNGVNFDIKEKEKVALIGDNGTGKTTLLKIIIDKLDEDDGEVIIQRNANIGFLSQTVIESIENTLNDEMLLVFNDLINIEKRLGELMIKVAENPNDKDLLEEYGKLEERFSAMGGYGYQTQIDMVLSKFKIDKSMYDRKLATFSGGERSKVAFAKLLLTKPELLILDEPTNHLDIDTIYWLENYLKGYDGAILLVTHDRYFIDKVCTKTLELVNNGVEVYNGNYTYYLKEREIRIRNAKVAYERQQKEIADMEQFIKRFRYKATKAKQAKDRMKKLDRIERIEKPVVTNNKTIKFNIEGKRIGKAPILQADNLVVGYEKPLFNAISFNISEGSKLAIIGGNGVGKTTLIKTLIGELNSLGGEVLWNKSPKFAYFDQNQFILNDDDSLFDVVKNMFPNWDNLAVRNALANYDFKGEDVFKKVGVLSGGERVRLLFLKLLLTESDVLLLDEPTNHLDIGTKSMLENALVTVNKTVIFISHDRYFINEVADSILNIESGVVEFHNTKLNEFYALKEEALATVKKESRVKVQRSKDSCKKQIQKLESKIEDLEKRMSEIKELMFLEENYLDTVKSKQLNGEYEEIQLEIDELFVELEEMYEGEV